VRHVLVLVPLEADATTLPPLPDDILVRERDRCIVCAFDSDSLAEFEVRSNDAFASIKSYIADHGVPTQGGI